MFTALLASGCGESRPVREERLVRQQRVERLLGLRPPYQADAASFDECGVWATRIRAKGDSLDVFLDRRPVPPDSAGGLPPSAWRVWIHARPDSPRAEAFAINSPAESAVVDLVRLAISTTFTAGEESALVRKEREAARKPQPEYEANVLSSSLSARERGLRQVRSFLIAMEWRRRLAAGPP